MSTAASPGEQERIIESFLQKKARNGDISIDEFFQILETYKAFDGPEQRETFKRDMLSKCSELGEGKTMSLESFMHYIMWDEDEGKAKEQFPEPQPQAIMMQDPRNGGQIGVIGFYYPGKPEAWDVKCGGGFMGNFWDHGRGGISVKPPCAQNRSYFTNAEAAFQALKFWNKVDQFKDKSGNEAFHLKRSLQGHEDYTYGKYGHNWGGMYGVLRNKFRKGSTCCEALKKTGDAYLLEQNAVSGRDYIWSNNKVGDGKNWLGLQIMLIRDEVNGTTGPGSWTEYVTQVCKINTSNGKPITQEKADDDAFCQKWQESVLTGTKAIAASCGFSIDVPTSSGGGGPAICPRVGCGKPTYNGKPGEYCGRSCQAKGPPNIPA